LRAILVVHVGGLRPHFPDKAPTSFQRIMEVGGDYQGPAGAQPPTPAPAGPDIRAGV
jgi:hypothetical protein